MFTTTRGSRKHHNTNLQYDWARVEAAASVFMAIDKGIVLWRHTLYSHNLIIPQSHILQTRPSSFIKRTFKNTTTPKIPTPQ